MWINNSFVVMNFYPYFNLGIIDQSWSQIILWNIVYVHVYFTSNNMKISHVYLHHGNTFELRNLFVVIISSMEIRQIMIFECIFITCLCVVFEWFIPTLKKYTHIYIYYILEALILYTNHTTNDITTDHIDLDNRH